MFHPHAPDPDDDDIDDESWPVPVESPLTHDGMPIRGWHYGEPIPDLDRIPQEHWREVLAPLRRATRQVAMSATQRDFRAAAVLVGELLADARPTDLEEPPPMPAPRAAGAGRRPAGELPPRGRRLRAARSRGALFAMRPATLARVLTVRGVDRALYEERRDP
jgi:hypothetical protein